LKLAYKQSTSSSEVFKQQDTVYHAFCYITYT